MAYDIGPTVGVLGEAEFKKAMAGIGNEFKLLDSEMKLSVSQFEKNDKSMAALGAQSKVLGKEIDTQKGKILLITEQYDKQNTKLTELKTKLDATKAAYAADSAEVAKARNEYNNQSAAVTKLGTDLNNANATLNKYTGELAKNQNAALQAANAQKEMGEKIQKAGTQISGVGSNLTKYLTVPVLAAAAGLAALVIKTTGVAGELQKMSDVTGFTVERIQELKYVGADLDIEFETIMKSQTKLTQGMKLASDGGKLQSEAFKTLGVEILGADGHMRDAKVVMLETIDALGSVGNETERDALSLKIFGKSAMELNPLIKAGSEKIAELSEAARANGAVMSGESVAALDAFGDAIEEAKISIGTAAGEIAVKMLPTLNKLLPIVQKDIVPAIGEFAEGVGDLIVGFNNLDPITKGVVTTLAGIIVVAGPALKMVGTGITFIGTINTALAAHKIALATAAAATNGLAASETGAAAAGTAMAASLAPIAVAAAGVIAVGGMMALTYDNATKSSRATKEEAESLARTLAAESGEYEKQNETVRISAESSRKLSDELYNLAEKENKSNEEKSRMQTLVTQLNAIYPELALSIDKVSGSVNKGKDATEDYIASKFKEIKLAAQTERLTELYKEQADIQIKLSDATGQYERDTIALQIAQRDAAHGNVFAAQSLGLLGINVKNSSDAVSSLSGAFNKTATDIASVSDAYIAESGTIVSANDQIVKSGKVTTKLTEEQIKAQTEMLEQRTKDIEQYYKDLYQSAKDHLAEMGSIETYGIEQSDLTAKQAKKNRDKVAADYRDWREDLKEIAQLVPADVLAELEKMGPKYDLIIDDLAKMTPEQIAAWVESYRAPAAEAAKAAEEEITKIPGVALDTGNRTADEYAYGLRTNQGTAEEAAKNAALAVAEALKGSSGEVIDTGSRTIDDYTYGLRTARSDAVTEAQDTADKITGVFEDSKTTMSDLGAESIDSLVDGMATKDWAARAKAREIAKAIVDSYKNEMDMNSPSKVMGKAGKDTFSPIVTEAEKAQTKLDLSTRKMAGTMIKNLSVSPSVLPDKINAGNYAGAAEMTAMRNYKSIPTVNNTNTNASMTINVATLVVRTEEDVPKIAKQLFALKTDARKAVGG